MRIDIFSDIACPWCYIGLTRFNRVLADFEHRDDVAVEVHSFQLDPSLPESYAGTETDYVAALKGLPADSVRQMFGHVRDAAATENLTLDFDRLAVANSWRAHRLIHAAREVDAATAIAVKMALFEAHFENGESISDPAVLRRIAAAHGVPTDLAEQAASGPAQRPTDADELDQAVEADLAQAAQLQITGVPFFVLAGKYGLSGAQPAEVFTQALRQVWDETHPVKVPLLAGLPDASGPSCGPDGCD